MMAFLKYADMQTEKILCAGDGGERSFAEKETNIQKEILKLKPISHRQLNRNSLFLLI